MSELSTTLITLTPPTLGTGYCPASYQQLADDIIDGTEATFNSSVGNSFFSTGSSTPTDIDFPWLDDDGYWWQYSNGCWNRKHPEPTNSSVRRIYVGSTTDLLSYDGGDGTSTASTYAGPMWEVDSVFAASFPVGVGTFAASGTVSVGGTSTSTAVSGEDKHTLTTAELPAHTHTVTAKSGLDINATSTRTLYGSGAEFTGSSDTSSVGSGAAHNNLPPFVGVYFIKRTSRQYYVK